MSRLAVACMVGLMGMALFATPARAVDTLEYVDITGNPDNRIDLVILAEGYTPAEAELFRQHVDALVAGLFAYDPWSNYQGAFNLYRIVTESSESGADHPSQGLYRDTYLDATYDYLGVERLLVVNEGMAAAVAASLVPEVDVVVVLVNDELYGGSGGSVVTVSATDVAVQILTHELGHNLANLADEYSDPLPGVPPGDSEPNVDFDFAFGDLKWNAWVDPTTPLPSLLADALDDYNPVGAYEGARYLDTGIYRPAPSCMMRDVSYEYCAVCREALVLAFHDWVDPIDVWHPPEDIVYVDLGNSQSYPAYFQVQLVEIGDATGLSISWWLDDVQVGNDWFVELGIAELGTTEANHDLRCEVTDPTPWVRNDPDDSLTGVRHWQIQVRGAVYEDAGPPPDVFTDWVGPQRGCDCRSSPSPSTFPLWLLLVLLWIVSRRKACRARKSAWRRRRGPG